MDHFMAMFGSNFTSIESWNQNYLAIRKPEIFVLANISKEFFMAEVISSMNWDKNKGRNILIMLDTARKIERSMKEKYQKMKQPEQKFIPETPFSKMFEKLLKLDINDTLSPDKEFPKDCLFRWSKVKLLRAVDPPKVRTVGHNMSLSDVFKPINNKKVKKSKKSRIPLSVPQKRVPGIEFTSPYGSELKIVDRSEQLGYKRVTSKNREIKEHITSHELYSEDSDELIADCLRKELTGFYSHSLIKDQ